VGVALEKRERLGRSWALPVKKKPSFGYAPLVRAFRPAEVTACAQHSYLLLPLLIVLIFLFYFFFSNARPYIKSEYVLFSPSLLLTLPPTSLTPRPPSRALVAARRRTPYVSLFLFSCCFFCFSFCTYSFSGLEIFFLLLLANCHLFQIAECRCSCQGCRRQAIDRRQGGSRTPEEARQR